MVDLNAVFKDVSQGASMRADEYPHATWNLIGSDVMGTLIMRDGVWRAYEEFLLWLEDQGCEIVLFSNDPHRAHERMIEEGCNPRLLEKTIVDKVTFLQQADEKQANIAVVIDDQTSLLETQHVKYIVDPVDHVFQHYVGEQLYLSTEATAQPEVHVG